MRLARMCSDTVHARSHDHNRTAVTVFAASHNGSETRLWYALDDLSNGLMQGFRGTAIHDERERETTTPPEVRWCGHAASVQAYIRLPWPAPRAHSRWATWLLHYGDRRPFFTNPEQR